MITQIPNNVTMNQNDKILRGQNIHKLYTLGDLDIHTQGYQHLEHETFVRPTKHLLGRTLTCIELKI